MEQHDPLWRTCTKAFAKPYQHAHRTAVSQVPQPVSQIPHITSNGSVDDRSTIRTPRFVVGRRHIFPRAKSASTESPQKILVVMNLVSSEYSDPETYAATYGKILSPTISSDHPSNRDRDGPSGHDDLLIDCSNRFLTNLAMMTTSLVGFAIGWNLYLAARTTYFLRTSVQSDYSDHCTSVSRA